MWHNISPGNADNGSFNRIRKNFVRVPFFCRLQSLPDMTPMSWPSAGTGDVMQLHGGWLVHSRHTPDPPGPTARAAETAAGLRLALDARVKTKHDQLFIHTQLFTPARSTSCLSPRPRSPASSNSPVFNKSGVEMRKISIYMLSCCSPSNYLISDTHSG